ncbi:MAG: response regulator transcription factor [Actinobacteria bacterium]|nr:MAG: response regulator transcription factor [Actinomycetota bacterium]
MNAQRILVVDAEAPSLKVVDRALTAEGFEVVTAADAASGEEAFATSRPDLVILDVTLPDRSGLEVARGLRASSNVPIIILSARADEVDRVLGLEFGADDYVAKPFSARELVSRVKAILRRAAGCADDRSVIEVGELRIDAASREVTLRGVPAHLTRTEYDILLHLARHPGTAFSREEIIAALAAEPAIADERAIDVHIHNIREKLEPDPRDPAYVLTVRGFGYRLRGQ